MIKVSFKRLNPEALKRRVDELSRLIVLTHFYEGMAIFSGDKLAIHGKRKEERKYTFTRGEGLNNRAIQACRYPEEL